MNGMSTVTFSISAGEGRNIVLRNLLGKIAANLQLLSSLPDADTPLQTIDGFADEGAAALEPDWCPAQPARCELARSFMLRPARSFMQRLRRALLRFQATGSARST